jgi:flagellar biosynthesis protein FlhF
MQVKKYAEKSMQAAVSRIKKEMGDDAVILSTRRIPKGSMNPYGHDIFEVEASVESSVKKTMAPADVIPRFQTAKKNKPANPSAFKHDVNKKNIFKTEVPEGIEPEKAWNRVSNELEAIKDVLFCLSGKNNSELVANLCKEEKDLYIKLIKNGISENRVKFFIEKVKNKEYNTETTNEKSLKNFSGNVINKILESIPARNIFPESDFLPDIKTGPSVAAFTGPTGGGKTTTIAKIAAWLSLERRKKVGLISIDSYRIGAVEQLKTYSSIMGIPCISAYSSDDLKKAVRKLESMDFILIDTAGQSHLDKKRLKDLETIITNINGIENHLVLSTTMDRLNMLEATKNFSILKPASYIFTKVDETRRRGVIVDQVMDYLMPVSVITNGQKVPEDFLMASQRVLMEVIIGKNYLH